MWRPEAEDNKEKFSEIIGTITLGITMAKWGYDNKKDIGGQHL